MKYKMYGRCHFVARQHAWCNEKQCILCLLRHAAKSHKCLSGHAFSIPLTIMNVIKIGAIQIVFISEYWTS
jgi:hypothetical protein